MEAPGEKLLTKLWETLAEKGLGSLLAPWQARRVGRATTEVRQREMLLLAQAEHDAVEIRAGRKRLVEDGDRLRIEADVGSSSLKLLPVERIEPTIDLQPLVEVARSRDMAEAALAEIHTAKAILFAEDALSEDAQVPPDRGIDDDWLNAWRQHASRVSNEDLQRMWGSALAGEVRSPGSCSIRTLDFLRALSREEANLISKLAPFAVEGRVVKEGYAVMPLIGEGLSFDELLVLQELGVVQGVGAAGFQSKMPTAVLGEKYLRPLRAHNKALIVEHEEAGKIVTLDVYLLTAIGKQVLQLGSFKANEEYLASVGRKIVQQGFSVLMVDWINVSETQGQYRNAVTIEAAIQSDH